MTKAGTPVGDPAAVTITAEQPKYVCRAGLKLEAALQHWGIDVCGKAALDSGLSTGGFTDCLLQHGAARVVGVDVGYGQVRAGRGGRHRRPGIGGSVPCCTSAAAWCAACPSIDAALLLSALSPPGSAAAARWRSACAPTRAWR